MSNIWVDNIVALKELATEVGIEGCEFQEILNKHYNEYMHIVEKTNTVELLATILDIGEIHPPEKLKRLLENQESNVAINMKGINFWYNEFTGHFHHTS